MPMSGNLTRRLPHETQAHSCALCSAPLPSDNLGLCLQCRSKLQNQGSYPDASFNLDASTKPAGVNYQKTVSGFKVRAAMPVVSSTLLFGIAAIWCALSFYWILRTNLAAIEALRSVVLPITFGTAFMGSLMLLHFGGQLVIQSEGDEACVFRGVGPFGSRQRFLWSTVRFVGEKQMEKKTCLVIQSQNPIEFGDELPQEVRTRLCGGVDPVALTNRHASKQCHSEL